MLRTLVLLLVIATPLLSQDLLVDSIDREFAGTLIKITDTYIFFQIQGETEPVQYPFWAVKRVTLADGSLAFEDGKTYVAEPTLPVKARPAEPRPTVPKPEEPQPMEVGPEEPPPEEPRPTEIADDEKDKRPPLLSQDLLVDSKGREHSGTLIEITDTHIHFQLQGRTTPNIIPLGSVKRVILADGSIAYEGEPEPAKTGVAAAGEPPVFTEAALRTMALKNAARNHNTAAWVVGGGCLGCGGMYLGAILGETIAEFPGFILGAMVGGVAAPVWRASNPDIEVPIPEELESADPELREKYHQLYRAEVRELRKRSVYRGAAIPVTCVGLLILSFLLTW